MGDALIETELLPCPFCGGKAKIEFLFGDRKRTGWRFPTCEDSECPGHTQEQDEQGGTHLDCKTDAEAIALWNRRNPDGPEAASRIAELETEIARRDAVAAAKWGDQKDEWSDAINAEHPVNSTDPERFRRFDLALEMIGKRHGKYELVGLAAWLIARAERAEAKLDEAGKALGSIARNTCCGSCQEAALVARQALASIQERT